MTSRITLSTMYADYLNTQVPDAIFEEEMSTDKYSCWSIPHKKDYTVHNWLGEYMGTGVIQSKRYVWIGTKGAVYITGSPVLKYDDHLDQSFVVEMKRWVWKKYFNIDL